MDPLPASNKFSQLLNPYPLTQPEMERAQAWVSPEDRRLLSSVYPVRGIETYLIAGFYKKICSQLREENITSYSPQNARRVHEIITAHLAFVCTPRQGHIANVTGGADTVHQSHEDVTNVTSNPSKTTPRRRGNLGGKRSGGKQKDTKAEGTKGGGC